jgi:hypothetical protein
VTAKVFRPPCAAAVAIEAGHGVIATRLQRATKNVALSHGTSIADAHNVGSVRRWRVESESLN